MAQVMPGFAPSIHAMMNTTFKPKIYGSNVFIKPRAIHLDVNGRNAWVPYALNKSTNTCKQTAIKVQSHRWKKFTSGTKRKMIPDTINPHKIIAGREWDAPR